MTRAHTQSRIERQTGDLLTEIYGCLSGLAHVNALDADGSAFVIRLKYECSKTLDVWIVPSARHWRGRKDLHFHLQKNFLHSYQRPSSSPCFYCPGGPSGWAWGRMKATGRPLLTPIRSILLNLFFEERAGTHARRPVCRRCLHALQSNAWVSQRISRLSAARTRHRPISPCGFWHEETRRRRGPTLQTRSLATVQEGRWFQLPKLPRINRPGTTLNV